MFEHFVRVVVKHKTWLQFLGISLITILLMIVSKIAHDTWGSPQWIGTVIGLVLLVLFGISQGENVPLGGDTDASDCCVCHTK